MTLRLLVVAPLLLALSACELRNFTGESPLGDEDTVAIRARVLLPGGAPAGAADWTLARTRGDKTGKTGADGALAIGLKGYETKNGFGEAEFMDLKLVQGEYAQSIRVQARKTEVQLGDLAFWDGWREPAAGATFGDELRLGWDAPSNAGWRYVLGIADARSGGRLADLVLERPEATLGGYAFEDAASYRLTLSADDVAGRTFKGGSRVVTAPAGATAKLIPVRAVTDDMGQAYPGLFDANLYAAARPDAAPPDPDAPRPRRLLIDLGEARAVARVVGYGFPAGGVVQATDADGAGGPSGASIGGEDLFDVPLGGVKTRYLRIAHTDGARYGQASEIRVVAP